MASVSAPVRRTPRIDEAGRVHRKLTGHDRTPGSGAKTSVRPLPDDLTCAVESVGSVAVVRLAGRLDLVTAVGARTALQKALTGLPTAILVDLAGLSVDDDVVLTLFSAFARTAAGWPGCPVLLYGPGSDLSAALDRTAVSRVVPVHADRASAVAAARVRPAPRRYEVRLAASPPAPAAARRLVTAACQAWQVPELADDAQLIITELVGNALRHAGGDIKVAVTIGKHFLHLAVRDGSPARPRMTLPDPETGEGGRGLILVDAVSAGWGSAPVNDGKRVWATLRIPRSWPARIY
jgi:anti-anti-sigma regulatory factor